METQHRQTVSFQGLLPFQHNLSIDLSLDHADPVTEALWVHL